MSAFVRGLFRLGGRAGTGRRSLRRRQPLPRRTTPSSQPAAGKPAPKDEPVDAVNVKAVGDAFQKAVL